MHTFRFRWLFNLQISSAISRVWVAIRRHRRVARDPIANRNLDVRVLHEQSSRLARFLRIGLSIVLPDEPDVLIQALLSAFVICYFG